MIATSSRVLLGGLFLLAACGGESVTGTPEGPGVVSVPSIGGSYAGVVNDEEDGITRSVIVSLRIGQVDNVLSGTFVLDARLSFGKLSYAPRIMTGRLEGTVGSGRMANVNVNLEQATCDGAIALSGTYDVATSRLTLEGAIPTTTSGQGCLMTIDQRATVVLTR